MIIARLKPGEEFSFAHTSARRKQEQEWGHVRAWGWNEKHCWGHSAGHAPMTLERYKVSPTPSCP